MRSTRTCLSRRHEFSCDEVDRFSRRVWPSPWASVPSIRNTCALHDRRCGEARLPRFARVTFRIGVRKALRGRRARARLPWGAPGWSARWTGCRRSSSQASHPRMPQWSTAGWDGPIQCRGPAGACQARRGPPDRLMASGDRQVRCRREFAPSTTGSIPLGEGRQCGLSDRRGCHQVREDGIDTHPARTPGRRRSSHRQTARAAGARPSACRPGRCRG